MKRENRFGAFAAKYKNIWKNEKFRRMYLTYFSSICAVCLVIFFIYCVTVYSMYRRTADMELSGYAEKALGKTANIFTMILSGLDQDISLIQQNKDVAGFLNLSQAQVKTLNNSMLKNSLIDLLFFTAVEDPYIQSVYVYSFKNDYLAANTDFKPRDQFYDTAWLEDYRQTQNPYFKARVRPNTNLDRQYNVLTRIREIRSDNGELIGLVIVNLSYSAFSAAISQVYGQTPDNLCVIGENGDILYSSDDSIVNNPVSDYPQIGRIAAEASRSGETVSFQGNRITTGTMVDNFVIISGTLDESMNRYVGTLISTFVIGATVGLATSLLLAFLVSVWQYNYMIRLIAVFPYPSPPGGQYGGESRYVGHSIAEQIGGQKKIDQELTVKLTELKKAQAIALQTQINPHFLLNSLQYVNLDILRKAKADTISTRIIALISDILRNNLNTDEYLTDLSQEIVNAKKYVQIINICSADSYHVEWDISSSVGSFKTVRFILQPILENCVSHGFANSQSGDRRIYVTARRDGDDLLIKVADNGKGMSRPALEELRTRISQSGIQEKNHIGLCNVDMRIRLIFGDKYGLTVTAEESAGMTVSIHMPIASF